MYAMCMDGQARISLKHQIIIIVGYVFCAKNFMLLKSHVHSVVIRCVEYNVDSL